jgi:outer membrane receptor protein involved in Fe transport
MASLLLAATFSTGDILAQAATHSFEITPQRLESALKAFSDVSDIQFLYVEEDIGQMKSGGVSGRLPNQDALDTLLEDTGLRYEYTNENTIRLYRQPEEYQGGSSSGGGAATHSLMLEEIVVTARKREESLQDVPIAVSVSSGEELRSKNVVNLQDLSLQVPNFYVAESFVGDSIFIRGIGSGQNNLGFEQAVGQVVDGVFYGRSRFSRVSFLDLERVEILKGPQGALIGKNTTAGAINITTAKPTSELEGYISGVYEFEGAEGYGVEGALSGPLGDRLAGRVAFNYQDKDGFIENTTTGEDDVSVDDLVARVSLAWDVSDTFDALFQYQYGDLEHEGGNNQYSYCDFESQQVPGVPVNFTAIFNSIAPDDCKANYKRSGTAGKRGVNVESKETEFDTFAVTLNWDLGDFTFTSVTGYAEYEYLDLQDGDRTAVDVVTVDTFGTLPEFGEDYEQVSQEFRLASPAGEKIDYLVGLYYLDKEQTTDYTVHFANIAGLPVSRTTMTNEEGTTYAAFGQLNWHINEAWDLTLGGRYTYEEKEARSVQFPRELFTDTPSDCMLPAAGSCFRHDIEDDFDDSNFSPSASLQWRPTDNSMYYVSVSRGFKAGGYDHLLVSNGATDLNIMDRFRFDEEEVTAFELGTKVTLADGAAQLNAAVFRSEFDDLQLGGFLNSTEVINTVTNAGSAISQGIEADFRWRATEGLTLAGAVAYLDSTYDDYEDAPCYTLQATGCVNGRQDLSDEKLQFAADWKGNLSAEHVWSLNDGMELSAFVQISYVDEFPLQADLDPKLFQDDYTKVDARLTLSGNNAAWELSLIGRNLDDEASSNYGDDVPGQAGSVWRSMDAPRSYALQLVARF